MTNLEVNPNPKGYFGMKKTVCFVVFLMVSVMATPSLGFHTNDVPNGMKGHGDGHCTKCGLKNGHYRCRAFWPIKGHPTDCHCGHSKNSHAYRR